MLSSHLCILSKNDRLAPSLDNIHRGKYTIGRFHITDAFIVEYMKMIYGVEIPDSWVNSCFLNIPDIDSRKIMYMECCDILSKDTINEIRKMVKFPPKNVVIYRDGEYIKNIKFCKNCGG